MRTVSFVAITAIPLTAGQELVKVMSGAQMKVLHTAMDLSLDGKVSLEEGVAFVRSLRNAVAQRQSKPILDTMDANKDGLLSLNEFKEDLRHFKLEAYACVPEAPPPSSGA